MHVDETIVAIASCPYGGLRGIVRVTGPDTVNCLRSIFRGTVDQSWWQVGRATRIPGAVLLAPPLGDAPCDLFLWPTERSYTRQPTAELHTLGASPLLQAVMKTVCQQGARLARPGEFTLRAFLAGRLDLAQAEAVLGVIDAVDDRQLGVALAQLAGGLSGPLTTLRDTLLNLCADLEAGLDFVDEDIQFISTEQLDRQLHAVRQSITDVLENMQGRGTADRLPRVVLRGEPNVGKSSLWNAMVTEARAIVSDIEGTTRDYLCGTVNRGEVAFTLVDTAGFESAGEDPLRNVIRGTTEKQTAEADLVLICIDSSRPTTVAEQSELQTTNANSHNRLVVLTKSDQPHCCSPGIETDVQTSATTGMGIDDLIGRCCEGLNSLGAESSVVSSTAVRCQESLRLVGESLQRACDISRSQAGEELIAAEIRVALEHLGEVVGTVYTDDILDRVFSRFCIGK